VRLLKAVNHKENGLVEDKLRFFKSPIKPQILSKKNQVVINENTTQNSETKLLAELDQLRRRVENLESENADLEMLVETITEHSDLVEDELGKKNELIRQIFGRYLTKEVVAQLLETPAGLTLGGKRARITILTSDLRGFTAISERLPAEEVIEVLNYYLALMTDVITEYEGTIDEFMGDGILVFFGAPNSREDDATRAIACAVSMQLAMKKVNEHLIQLDLPLLEMGIGINTGEVVVGNIGSEKRTKYGVVGNQVNLTYRIESYTTGGQIYISQSTLQEVGDIICVNSEKTVQPKGVQAPINIYEVGGIKGQYNLMLPKEEETFFSLKEPILLKYAFLEGKHLGENIFEAYVLELSHRGAKLYSECRRKGDLPIELTNIKLDLIGQFLLENPISPQELSQLNHDLLHEFSDELKGDIYAKVISVIPDQKTFTIRFTNCPPEVKVFLEGFLN
jgi:adenylate cyclase